MVVQGRGEWDLMSPVCTAVMLSVGGGVGGGGCACVFCVCVSMLACLC